MLDLFDEIGIQLGLLSAGFVAGLAVLGAEVEVFFSTMIFTMIIDALNNAIPVTEASQSMMSQYIGILAIISILGLIQGVSLGFLKRTSFSIGYCSGIFLMILLIGVELWDILQPVVIAMIVDIVTILIGIGLKVVIQNKTMNNRGNYYW